MATEEPKLSDRLAVDRTAYAAQRTLLAWVRTSLSLISFGFTIYKVLQQLQAAGITPIMRANGPRNVGLVLIFLGATSLSLATVDHWRTLRGLGRTPKQICQYTGLSLAVIIVLAGVFLFISILTHMEIV